MAQDTVDAAVFANVANNRKLKKVPSIEALNSEMPCRDLPKDRGVKLFKCLLNRLRLKKYASATISRPDPTYRVAYLGNVVTGWAKGDGCVEKPLATLWRNYTQSSRPDVRMHLTVGSGGLKAATKEHGLTEYWAHRLTTCAAPAQFPRLFCWVYRHEGRRLRHELRCHAVLCSSASVAKEIEKELKHSLALALAEFKRDKVSRQNARLSLVNSVYENPTIPRRKILLSTGSQNYRPPLERSKSAPKLTSIEEIIEEEDSIDTNKNIYKRILKHYDSTNALLEKRRSYVLTKLQELENKESSNEYDQNKESKVKFNNEHDDLTSLDEKSDMILEELVKNSLTNDLLESCERAWYRALGEKPDLLVLDSDESSLSSGCESSTSTAVSEVDQPVFPAISEENLLVDDSNERKTDVDFKVGAPVLARVRSFERMNGGDILKYNIYNSGKTIMGPEEVSLIPVGESHSDFSSLKVFKKRSFSEGNRDMMGYGCEQDSVDLLMKGDCVQGDEEEEKKSSCSDESGYEEDLASTVGNVVLV